MKSLTEVLKKDNPIVQKIKSIKIIDLGNPDKPNISDKVESAIKEPNELALAIFIKSDKLVYIQIPL